MGILYRPTRYHCSYLNRSFAFQVFVRDLHQTLKSAWLRATGPRTTAWAWTWISTLEACPRPASALSPRADRRRHCRRLGISLQGLGRTLKHPRCILVPDRKVCCATWTVNPSSRLSALVSSHSQVERAASICQQWEPVQAGQSKACPSILVARPRASPKLVA